MMRRQGGFTIIEIMIVVVIIGIIAAIAIVTEAASPSAPCGACRQVLWEFVVPDLDHSPGLRVYLAGANTDVAAAVTLEQLLPMPFGPADLIT